MPRPSGAPQKEITEAEHAEFRLRLCRTYGAQFQFASFPTLPASLRSTSSMG
jgi:hypothetical protein